MKKLIVTIIILLVIFIGMVIYRAQEKEAEVKIDEVNKIEEYMAKVYGWKEITNEALPVFSDINNADEKWIWGTVRQNIDGYEINYGKIEETAKKIYGSSFNKQFPKDGTEYISYDEAAQKYIINDITIDAIKDSFYIQKIEKNKNTYIAKIVEYLVDYTDAENGKVVIKNLNDETITQLTQETATESNITKVVKDNMDKFTKKKVTIEKEGDNLVIKTVEKE